MKRRILSCLLIVSLVLAGCTGKTGNLQGSTGDTETETVPTDMVLPDDRVKPSANVGLDDNDSSAKTYIDFDYDSYNETDEEHIFEFDFDKDTIHEDGSVDLIFADDRILNSNDFRSTERYVRIVDFFVYGNETNTRFFDIAREYPKYAEGDFDMNVTKDLVLPTETDGVKIEWTSSDENLITNEGVVKRPHEHSRFVMLTAVLSKDDSELISRYIVKVARDMYDDVTADMIVDLEYGYGNLYVFDEMDVDLSEYDGWFYSYYDMEQLYFFQEDLDRVLLFGDTGGGMTIHNQGVGDLFEVKPETLHEAYLAACCLREAVGCDDRYELRYEGYMTGIAEDYYDFVQYYNDVPTTGSIRLGIGYNEIPNSFNSWILQIPDGFDTAVNYTMEDMKKDFELYEDPELRIDNRDEEIVLTWTGYTKNHMCVMVDAKTGEVLYEGSTIIID